MKRISSFLLALVMMLSVLGSVSFVQASEWKSGDSITVTADNGVLTVSGKGDMKNYSATDLPEWSKSAADALAIKSIVIENGVTSVGDFAFSSLFMTEEVSIPDSVTYIGKRAFSGCSNLKSVNIPASVETIGDYAFSTGVKDTTNGVRMVSLAEITVDSNNKYFTVENGILYNSAKTVLYKIPPKMGINSLDVNSGIITVKEAAAQDCTGLVEVNLPASVSYVCASAFADCTGLQKVTVNNKNCELETKSIPDNEGLKLYGYNGNVGLYAQNNNCTNIEFIALDTEEECTHVNTAVKNKTDATCTADGYTGDVYCTDCGETLETGTVIKATGHKYDSGKVTKAATCTATGVKTYTCTVCKATKTETIAKTAHTYKKYITPATTSKDGSTVNKCSVCGAKKSTSTIYKISSVALSTTSTYYNGSVKTPSVTVKNSRGTTLKKGTDYDVTYASGRKNVGRYAVTVKFKGNYSGSKTLYFNIIPKGISGIKSITARSKGFTVQWPTQKTQTTGYQIQYSTSSNFSNAKTITMGKPDYYAKKVTGLQGNKKYYVRIRTYKVTKFNGKNYNIYSPWCAAKSVTTKK